MKYILAHLEMSDFTCELISIIKVSKIYNLEKEQLRSYQKPVMSWIYTYLNAHSDANTHGHK